MLLLTRAGHLYETTKQHIFFNHNARAYMYMYMYTHMCIMYGRLALRAINPAYPNLRMSSQ